MKKLLLLTLLCLVCGAIQSAFAQKLEDNCSTEAFITDKDQNELNVRDRPHISGKVIATLKENIKDEDFIVLYITGYSNGWAKIGSAKKVDGGDELLANGGWVSAKMIGVATKGTVGGYDAPAPFY